MRLKTFLNVFTVSIFKCAGINYETGYKTEPFNSKGSYIIVELDYSIHTLNERWKTFRSSPLYGYKWAEIESITS